MANASSTSCKVRWASCSKPCSRLQAPKSPGRWRSMSAPRSPNALVPRLADFTARYPAVVLDIRVGNDTVDFRTQNIDLALYFTSDTFPGLIASKLMDEQIAPVCSPQYAQRHGLLDNPDNLAQCTLLHDSLAWDNAAYDAEWQLWARHSGMEAKLPVRSLTFDRSDLCALAAVNHAGIAIGRSRLVQQRL